MKKMLLLCVAVIALLQVNAQEKSPDSVIQRVFRAVKNNDEAAFVKVFPDLEGMLVMLKEFDPNGLDVEADSMIRAQYAGALKEDFREFMNRLENKGVRHSQLVFVKADYSVDEMKMSDNPEGHSREASGIIYVKADGEEYEIPFGDLIWSDELKGWFGIHLKSFRKKGEVEEDDFMIEDIP